MTRRYQSREKAESRYEDENEIRAFRLGYSRGYDGSTRTPRQHDGFSFWFYQNYPNAWSAGYWEGFGDAGRS